MGLEDEYDASSQAKFRTNEADVIIEFEELGAVLSSFGIKGLLPCFEAGEGVMKFLLLVLEGLDEV